MLDRIWLGLITASALVWLVIMVDRLGFGFVLVFIALAYVFRDSSPPPQL